MTRAQFLVWLLELIRQAPELDVSAAALPETEEFVAGIEVVMSGTTFWIAVEEHEAD